MSSEVKHKYIHVCLVLALFKHAIYLWAGSMIVLALALTLGFGGKWAKAYQH